MTECYESSKTVMCVRPVADRLKSGCASEPESYESVTLIFSDVANFDQIAAKSSPLHLCSMLNDIYYTLDELIDDYDVFKVNCSLFNIYNQ